MARRIPAVIRLALGALLLNGILPAMSSGRETPVAAAWVHRTHTLHYVGFYSQYSCDWLEEKLRMLLKASGARRDMAITTSCIVVGRPSPDATARIEFYSLAPIDLAGGAPETDAAVARAEWRPVVLRDHSPLALEAADCELVEQFRDQLLPLFTTRAMANKTHCRPGENAPGDLNLQFEVLAAQAAPIPERRAAR